MLCQDSTSVSLLIIFFFVTLNGMVNKKILIADDEAEIRNILAEDLKDIEETTIMTAVDGLDAYRKTRNQKFDLIITDFKMPKLTGSELISALREQVYNANTPVIVVSGFPDEAKQKCVEHGINTNIEYIEKPFDNAELKKRCERLLKEGKTIAAKPKLDAEFINPFLNAVSHTLKGMGQVADVKAMKTILLKPGEEKHADITGSLAIVAPAFVGTIAVSFPAKTYLAVVSNMLGKQYTEITSEIEDAAAEVVNVVYGNAKSVLNEKNYQMEKAIPSLIKGANHAIRSDAQSPTLVTEFTSAAGPFFVSISIDLRSKANTKSA